MLKITAVQILQYIYIYTIYLYINIYISPSRYISVSFPQKGATICTIQRAKVSVFLVTISTSVVCLLNFVTLTIDSLPFNTTIESPLLTNITTMNETFLGSVDVENLVPVTGLPFQGPSSPTGEIQSPPQHNHSTQSPLYHHHQQQHRHHHHHLQQTQTHKHTEYVYFVGFKTKTDGDIILKNLNFWIQALLVKMIPCLGMIVLSFLLKRKMTSAQRKRRQLLRVAQGKAATTSTSNNVAPSAENQRQQKPASSASSKKKSGLDARQRRTHRTTRMLVIIVFLFAATEFPNGMLNLLSGILDHAFVQEIYDPLGDPLDFLTLVNSAINFILYCSMSMQFRKTFAEVFLEPLTSLVARKLGSSQLPLAQIPLTEAGGVD